MVPEIDLAEDHMHTTSLSLSFIQFANQIFKTK